MVSLMVGGAIEAQMDGCLEAMGAPPRTTPSTELLNSSSMMTTVSAAAGGDYNLSTTTASLLNMSAVSSGNDTVTQSILGDAVTPELTCRIGIATTLTILVGLCQVKHK